MRVTKHHLGVGFELWKSQQSWFWFVENTNGNGMIGAAATQAAAIDDARSSIEEIANSDARTRWECTLGKLARYLASVRDTSEEGKSDDYHHCLRLGS